MDTRSERLGRELGRLARQHPRSTKAAVAFVACLGLAVWASYPPKELAIDNACMPDGFWKAVSEAVYGNKFWRRQIQAVTTGLQSLEREPIAIAAANAQIASANAQIEAQLQKSKAFLEEQYGRFPQLTPSPAQQYVSQLRELADKVENEEILAASETAAAAMRARRIDWLIRCAAKLEQQHGGVK